MATIIKAKIRSLKLYHIILLFSLLKIVVIITSHIDVTQPFNPLQALFNSCYVNPDEFSIAKVAHTYNQGFGYASDADYAQGLLRKTAWRPTLPVWLHIVGLRLYTQFYPGQTIEFYPGFMYFVYYGFFYKPFILYFTHSHYIIFIKSASY